MTRPEHGTPDLRVAVPTLEPDDVFLARLSTLAAGSASRAAASRVAPVGSGWRAPLAAACATAVLAGGAWAIGNLATESSEPPTSPVTRPPAPETSDPAPRPKDPDEQGPGRRGSGQAAPGEGDDDSTAPGGSGPGQDEGVDAPTDPGQQQEPEGGAPADQPDEATDPHGSGENDDGSDNHGDEQPEPETEEPDDDRSNQGEDDEEDPPDEDDSDPDDATDDRDD